MVDMKSIGGIKATNIKIDDPNRRNNDSHVYIARKKNASQSYFSWENNQYYEVHWSKYQIKESDNRTKTATFSSPNYLDLTTGQYLVLIQSELHENFGGVILSVDYDEETGLYDYQCQDYSRLYQGKFDLVVSGKTTLYRVLKFLITRGAVPLRGNDTKQVKEWKNELSGLLPRYQYNQKYWFVGSKKDYNPFEWKKKLIIRNKSWIEAIRDIVYGTDMFVDVYFNKDGVIQIEPYLNTDYYNTGLYLTTSEVANRKFQFDTTNIITGVVVHSTDKTEAGKYYDSKDLVNLDLSAFFGDLTTSIDNPNQSTTKTKSDKKQSQNTKNQNNPYNTKKKKVEISSDNIKGKSKDRAFLNKIEQLLKKEGWKVTNHGVGSNMHSEKHLKIKDGVHFCIMGGVDAGMIREVTMNSSYVKKQKKLNCRTVWGWTPPASDIRKGGKRYKFMPRAHDDNYSPSGFKGVSYPSEKLAKWKVPFMYASTPEDMVAKFLKGGDMESAL